MSSPYLNKLFAASLRDLEHDLRIQLAGGPVSHLLSQPIEAHTGDLAPTSSGTSLEEVALLHTLLVVTKASPEMYKLNLQISH